MVRHNSLCQEDVGYEFSFLHVVRHPEKSQIYSIISNIFGQAYPKLFKQQIIYPKKHMTNEVDFLHMARCTYFHLIQFIHLGVVRHI